MVVEDASDHGNGSVVRHFVEVVFRSSEHGFGYVGWRKDDASVADPLAFVDRFEHPFSVDFLELLGVVGADVVAHFLVLA